MPWHGVDHVLDTPDCNAAPDFELQPNGPIHVQSGKIYANTHIVGILSTDYYSKSAIS